MVSGIISRAATRGELTDGYVANLFSELTEAKLRAAHMSGSVDAVATWVQDQARQPYVHPAVIRETAEYLARSNPAKAINWLDAIHATPGRTDGNPQGYGVVLNEWARQDGAKVVSLWLTTQSNHRGYDHMVTQYTSILATKDPTEAARLAMTIKDQGMRQSAIQRITAASRTAKKGK